MLTKESPRARWRKTRDRSRRFSFRESGRRADDRLGGRAGEAHALAKEGGSIRIRRLGERGLHRGPPEVAEQDERFGGDVSLDHRLGDPDELQHRAETVREEDPGVARIAEEAEAGGKVGDPGAVSQVSVAFPAALEENSEAPAAGFRGAAAGGFHDAAVSAADDAGAAAGDLTADFAGVLVGDTPLSREAGAEDGDREQGVRWWVVGGRDEGATERYDLPPTTYHLIEVDVAEGAGGVALGLFEKLVEFPVQDVFLGFFGFDRGGELLFPLGVLPFHGAHRVVHRGVLPGDLRRLVIDDRFQVRIHLQPGPATGTQNLKVHGPSLPPTYQPLRWRRSLLSRRSGRPSDLEGASRRSRRRASAISGDGGGVTSS